MIRPQEGNLLGFLLKRTVLNGRFQTDGSTREVLGWLEIGLKSGILDKKKPHRLTHGETFVFAYLLAAPSMAKKKPMERETNSRAFGKAMEEITRTRPSNSRIAQSFRFMRGLIPLVARQSL